MQIALIKKTTEKEKAEAVDKLIRNGSPDQDFFLLVMLSVAMATVGLIQNSVTAVIGSMLIAPMLYPIVGTAMGMAIGDGKLSLRSIRTVVISVILSLGSALFLTLFISLFMEIDVLNNAQLMERVSLNTLHILVAIIAGVAGSFALVKAEISESLPGTAIAVALMPPLATTGVMLALGKFAFAFSAFRLFLINMGGIIMAAVAVFMILNFSSRTVKKEVKETIAEEEKKIEAEVAISAPKSKKLAKNIKKIFKKK